MKLKTLCACLFATTLVAQAPPPRPGRLFRGEPPTDAVKAALGLTDADVARLEQIGKDQREAAKPLFDQIAERRRTLAETLKSTSPDPTALGRILLDIKDLREQIRQNDERYHEQAVAALSADQKAKLQTLEAAAQQRPAINQALRLNLLQPPVDTEAGVGPAGVRAPMMRGRMGRSGMRRPAPPQ